MVGLSVGMPRGTKPEHGDRHGGLSIDPRRVNGRNQFSRPMVLLDNYQNAT